MYRRHRSNPQLSLPWWLYAILGVVAYGFAMYFKSGNFGAFSLLPAFVPLFKLAALFFFILAAFSLIWQLIKSALGLNLLAQHFSPRSELTRFGMEMGKELFRFGLRKWEKSNRFPGAQPAGAHDQHANTGKALVLGESGAWRTFREKLADRYIYVERPEELQPLLQSMRAASKPALDLIHANISTCVRYKNAQISLLHAEPGLFTTVINWFLILKAKYDISRLFALEERFAALLAGDIAEVEATLQSPELAGALAELEVIEKLKELPGDCVVLNDLRLKARNIRRFKGGAALVSAQLDHLVITPAGVFVLETKRWSRKFAQEGVYHNPYDQVQRAGNVCFNLLKAEFGKVMVRNVIVCAGSLPTPPENSFTKVTNIGGLNGYILWFKENTLDPIELRDIREYLKASMPPPLARAPGKHLTPAERLNSALLRETLQRAEHAGFCEAGIKSRAVLIPTEPPPVKPQEDTRYMPPHMRRQVDEERKEQLQRRLAPSEAHTQPAPAPPYAEPSITSVARTIIRVCGAPENKLDSGAAAADTRVTPEAPAAGVKKLLIYAPDAIGRMAIAKFPAAFNGLEAAGFKKIELKSVYPSKTPVCYASMFTGLPPEGHGISQYEKPVLKCSTIFDVLPEYGLRTAIVAVKDSSIDLIFKERNVTYFSEPDDQAVTARALELIGAGNHDCLLAYHQDYDDVLHASDPWNETAQAALARHVRDFRLLYQAFDKKWQGISRAALFAPDHGAHTSPSTGKGTHGDDIPGDMEIAHYWKFDR